MCTIFSIHTASTREISHTEIRPITYWPADEVLKSAQGIQPTEANLKRITNGLEFVKISKTCSLKKKKKFKLLSIKTTAHNPSVMDDVWNKSVVP